MNFPRSRHTLDELKPIAHAFVAARQDGTAMADYPGTIPVDMATAYAIQDTAITLWSDDILGWKVGRIMGDAVSVHGEDRLVGPIFRKSVFTAPADETIALAAIPGGFAAVEGEFIMRLGRDAPAGKTSWSIEEARDIVDEVFCGIELAGSPFAGINDNGPCVTVSDFGNNAGLVIGAPLPGWQTRPMTQWACETFIDGKSVGTGNASAMPGGAFESLRFALARNAERGLPLQKGHLVSTGAITGVHEIHIGQSAEVTFVDGGSIRCAIQSVIA